MPGELPGPWHARVADDELRRRYVDDAVPDDGWEPIDVPGHWRTNPAFRGNDAPVLYRTRFATTDVTAEDTPAAGGGWPQDHRRSWLVLDGVFATSDVWLDGTYLGDTEGWFFAHQFEVSQQLAERDEHLLALEVTCPAAPDDGPKRLFTGAFQHPAIDPTWNPGGVWRPVRVEHTGPVRIRHSRVVCRRADERGAELFVRAVLDADATTEVELVTTVVPHADVDAGIESIRRQTLAAGENRVEWKVSVPEPRLWWPHRLGDQPLYDVTVTVGAPADGHRSFADAPVVTSDTVARTLGLRRVAVDDWEFTVNGERLFLRGAHLLPTRLDIADAPTGEAAGAVALARESDLDLLRVWAHVARPELYDAADAAGLLLWQDLPLAGPHQRSVRRQARRQAREAVDLLAHHPSVLLWCGHDDPTGRAERPLGEAMAGSLTPTWNRSVLDHSITKVLEETDGSRPVVPHSGVLPHPPQFDGTDSRIYATAVTGPDSLAEQLRRWPRLGRFVTDRRGDDDPVRRSTQIDTLRLLRFRPCGGFVLGVLGPATADVLAEACTLTTVVATTPPPLVHPGDTLELDLHVVNDRAIAYADIVVRVDLSWDSAHGPETHTWSWGGAVDADDLAYVATLRALVPDAPGPLEIAVHLHGVDHPVTRTYRTRIAPA